ncbi:hypothetical protein CVD28_05735 [Bacillus sp. M6-12]|uniref:DUF2243 domain-containing protein n=1 Tax=Bacillus sp. M6-12 TaxID=2054166 RepID=UPI000C77BB6D|nr:DUF2243 domain-containing protein [Bacillus sp. M6-12]PLS18637.1 hypothetical protein CVD28_05735 [Bacillus sp. M6-12]
MADSFFHIIEAFAAGLKAESAAGRIGAVVFGMAILILLMGIFKRFFSASFFQGFIVAAGLFLSFDIIVFHWIFQLHRITNGPEANWLEPILVVFGSVFVWYGIRREQQNNKFNKKPSMFRGA